MNTCLILAPYKKDIYYYCCFYYYYSRDFVESNLAGNTEAYRSTKDGFSPGNYAFSIKCAYTAIV